MKRYSLIYVAFMAMLTVLTLCGTSCRRASHNGKIDGYWRVERIEYFAPSAPETILKTETPKDRFIAIQLELFQLFAGDLPEYQVNAVATGIMSYDKKTERLGVEFPLKSSQANLAGFGILENPVMFDVETATCERLVLRTSTTRLICSKF